MPLQEATQWASLLLKAEPAPTTTVPGGSMATTAAPRRPTPSGTWATSLQPQKNSTTEPLGMSGSEAKMRAKALHLVTQPVSTTFRPDMPTTGNSWNTTPKTLRNSMNLPPSQILVL